MLGNQTVLIFSYFCFLPDPTTTPLPKGELITIHNIYRSLCCSYIVLRWTQETLLHFLTIQTRNNALNHLENACSPVFLVWALWHGLDDPTYVRSLEVAIWSYLHPSISTALMRPRRPKQYCLQLVIYIYTYIYIYIHTYIPISKTLQILKYLLSTCIPFLSKRHWRWKKRDIYIFKIYFKVATFLKLPPVD